ncbi:bifunctional diguanylate cyclase/phosphodiesterase [Noviherbaspirillum massiliense]|uniref:bifunctional diguanylate cyclase/phosphodiesterase n=1 Tax=Noviherbaspirillum massiliense TaxID=1465823 RepID=UPI0011DE186D|nr:EAL domain-containing protein [Noviherbaspirillum massiliense]
MSITSGKHEGDAYKHLATMYAVLGAINEAILHAQTPAELYQRVCEAAVEDGKLLTAALMVPDPATARVKVEAVVGMGEQGLHQARISIDPDSPEGQGLVGLAFRTQKSAVSNDFLKDERTRPWHVLAEKAGIAAGAAIPLLRDGHPAGVLLFYSAQKNAFDHKTVTLLDRIARNIAYALHNFEREAERKRTEEALRASEEKYRTILETMEEGYYEVDLKGRSLFFNSSTYKALGLTAEEFKGLSNLNYQTPEMAATVYKAFSEVYRTGQPLLNQDWEYRHKNGSIVRVEGSAHLIKDANGTPVGFRGLMRDVTARRKTEDALRASEERYRTIIESIGDAYYEVDLKGNLVFYNDAFVRMLGYAHSEMAGVNNRDYMTPEVAVTVYQAFNEVYLTGNSKHSQDWEHIRKDGSKIQVEGSIHLVRNSSGNPVGFRGILRDVTERRKMEQALRESEARFRALTNLSSDWYWEQDTEFRFTRLEGRHAKAAEIQGYFLGKPIWECGFEVQAEGGWDAHREFLAAQRPYRDIIMCRVLTDGSPFYISASGEAVFDGEGRFTGYRGVSREITDQKVAEERIQYLATHDGLTGLPNRAMFSHLLNAAISSSSRYERSFAVLFIDLDRFKFINDTLGHEAGDELLKEVTARFQKTLRASDTIARLGGDEFVVLIQETDHKDQAATVARKILAAAIQPVTLISQECRVTASIGIAMFPQDGEDEQTLMKNADIAMYFAKEEGKNNFQFYSKEIKSQSLERLLLESNLRRALERNEFTLHYQAKVDLRNRRITGVEALLRWHNAGLGAVSPAHFIPIAEETGLIVPIGKWALRTACLQNVAWQKQGLPPICMAVNLSVRQFADEHLLEDVAAVLKETGMAPHLLELEITEGMVVHNPERAIKLLTAIKKMGVRLAIDDFGTGYSSLGQLKSFPIDTLKVDRSFIRDLATSTGDKAITEAIIAMGKTLSLTVIAEGVETVEQETFLREHACDEMQGYYFSKPIGADEFAALLASHALPPQK